MTIGTQLQALYASPEGAHLMRYRCEKTQPLLEAIQKGEDVQFDDYDDVFTSFDYYHLVKSGTASNVVSSFALN